MQSDMIEWDVIINNEWLSALPDSTTTNSDTCSPEIASYQIVLPSLGR